MTQITASLKNSGIPWIGSIPIEWKTLPVKRIVAIPITDGPHETPEFVDDGIIFISAEALQVGHIDFNRKRGFITEAENRRFSRKYFPKTGDIYVVKSGATTGKSAIVGDFTEFNIWSPLAVIRVRDNMDNRFMLHVIRSQCIQDAIALSWSWGTQQNIAMGSLGRISVPVPPLGAQKDIADFLDRETARIDRLIEKKGRQVSLLAEKLDAFVNFWISQPHTSPSEPLHRFCQIVTGKTPSRSEEENFSEIDGVLWATPANLGFFDPIEDTKEKLSDEGLQGQIVVPPGTVLINGIGASIGKIGFAGKSLTFNQQIHGILHRKPLLTDRFLFFVMYTRKSEIISLGSNTTIPIINANRLGRIAVPLPDQDFQKMCVRAIEREVTRVGSVVKKVEESVERLHEFRSALITAAVTGQIDVATWGKCGTTDRQLDNFETETVAAAPPELEQARA